MIGSCVGSLARWVIIASSANTKQAPTAQSHIKSQSTDVFCEVSAKNYFDIRIVHQDVALPMAGSAEQSNSRGYSSAPKLQV